MHTGVLSLLMKHHDDWIEKIVNGDDDDGFGLHSDGDERQSTCWSEGQRSTLDERGEETSQEGAKMKSESRRRTVF
jgi:hypothetical protein